MKNYTITLTEEEMNTIQNAIGKAVTYALDTKNDESYEMAIKFVELGQKLKNEMNR